MSVVVSGLTHEVDQLIRFLHNYRDLCSDSGTETLGVPTHPSVLPLSTKYYSAAITLHSVELGALPSEDLITTSEGYILVGPGGDDLSHERHNLSRRMIEVETGLRLLVNFTTIAEDIISPTSQRFQEWALDNGFEYIEIDTSDLTSSHGEREKYGLPRLMEALESNMWSTMQRHTAGAANKPTAHPAAAVAPATSSSSVLQTAEAVTDASQGPSGASQPEPSDTATSRAAQKAEKAELDPLEEGLLADSEENEIIDKFANFISEAQQFRQQAVSGGISDEARRERAAAMALQLSMLMDLDEDSD